MLEGGGGVGHHDLPGAHLAGQRHLGDVGMGHEGLPGAVITLDDVEHTVGEPRFGVDLGKAQRG